VENFENRPEFIKVMKECIVAQFFDSLCITKLSNHKNVQTAYITA